VQLKQLKDSLWSAADKLRVDSGLKANEYATPILGLIFLRFACIRYNGYKGEIEAEFQKQQNSRKPQTLVNYTAIFISLVFDNDKGTSL